MERNDAFAFSPLTRSQRRASSRRSFQGTFELLDPLPLVDRLLYQPAIAFRESLQQVQDVLWAEELTFLAEP